MSKIAASWNIQSNLNPSKMRKRCDICAFFPKWQGRLYVWSKFMWKTLELSFYVPRQFNFQLMYFILFSVSRKSFQLKWQGEFRVERDKSSSEDPSPPFSSEPDKQPHTSHYPTCLNFCSLSLFSSCLPHLAGHNCRHPDPGIIRSFNLNFWEWAP